MKACNKVYSRIIFGLMMLCFCGVFFAQNTESATTTNNEKEILELAKSLNLDLEKLQDDANSLDTMHKIQADIDEAYSNHINGTPSTIINGKPHVGMKPYSEFKKWLKDEGATEK